MKTNRWMDGFLVGAVLFVLAATRPAVAAGYRAHTQTVTVTSSNTTVTFTDNGSGGDSAAVAAQRVTVYNLGPAVVFVDCKDGTASSADTAVAVGAAAEIVFVEGTGGVGYASCGLITASGTSTAVVTASHPGAVSLVPGGLITAEARTGQPVAAATGERRVLVGSLDGALYVRPGGPVSWNCSLDAIGITLTQCQAAPGAGLRLYLTDVVAQSTTATGGQFLLRYGTGTNCGTGTTSLLPAGASVVRLGYPGNAGVPTVIKMATPLVAAAANAICAVGVATNTLTIQLSGFIAP